MTPEDHLDSAIRDLQRAKDCCRTNSSFAMGCIGDARLAIAAAKIAIDHPAEPLRVRIVKSLDTVAA
jgi:hypothetical protein